MANKNLNMIQYLTFSFYACSISDNVIQKLLFQSIIDYTSNIFPIYLYSLRLRKIKF